MLAFYIPELVGGDFFASDAATRCKGECCTFSPEHRQALVSLKALEIAALGAFKADEFDPLDFEDGETGEGGWVQFEYALAYILSKAFVKHAKNLSGAVEPFLNGEGEAFDHAAFDAAAREADAVARIGLRDDLEEPVKKLLRDAVLYGEAEIARGLLNGVTMVDDVVNALTASTLHYSEEFFTAHILPAAYREIGVALANPLERPDLRHIFDAMSERLGGDAYWSIVANSNASRAFHYGYLRSAQIQGYTKAVFSAVMDEKTSSICENLNGRTWMIADLVRKYEAAASAQTTDELKQVAPWFRRDRSLPLDQDVRAFLIAGGVPCPPLHGRCRSTLHVI